MESGKKMRFGVSIPIELARELDKLASALGTSRSSIVSEALKEYIHDYAYYTKPHECSGIIVVTGMQRRERLFRVIEEFRDIVHSFNHMHVGGVCIEVLFVSGFSGRIRELHRTLMGIPGCQARYISVYYRGRKS